MKKIAVIVYPHFSLYEVTCLTEALMWFESPVEIFASSREPVRSEDGFLITPRQNVGRIFCRGLRLRGAARHDDPLPCAV